MFTRKTSPGVIGILFLSSMYLMGQGGWGADPCAENVCPCAYISCGANGSCVNNDGVAECICDAGFDGEFCDNNIPDCPDPDPCENGSCVDGIESYTCDCDDGYEGDSCETNIDECDPDPCLNDGICTDGLDSYSCECVGGYTGERCEIPPDMVAIPSGCFSMGEWRDEGGDDEKPAHQVCLSAFAMDIHEITNAEYAECVADEWCNFPNGGSSNTRAVYYGTTEYADFPVVRVKWWMVGDYCHWAGKRLPTEAEWEYAARGGLAGKRYPWGDTISGADANYGFTVGDTSMVESYAPNGYGLYDMAGNVWEWVEDDYHSHYYGAPTDGSAWVDDPRYVRRVMRGGSWFFAASYIRLTYRGFNRYPSYDGNQSGGRCAVDMRDLLY